MDVRAMIGAALNRTFACLSRFRAIFFVIALGLSLATTNVCPAGQSDCEMADMDAGVEMSAVCILACGVLLPSEATVAPEFVGKVASLFRPDDLAGIGMLLEPQLRPPRVLG